MRIEDILTLHLQDIVMDGGRYRLNVIEKKTKKKRTFTVPVPVYSFIRIYCDDRNIAPDQKMFSVGERQVQKYLKKVVDYLGYEEPIGSHSFRKYFATEIYISKIIMILCLCRSSCSIAVLPLHNGTLTWIIE